MKHNRTNVTNIAATLASAIIMIFTLLLAPVSAQAQTISVGNETALRNAIASYNSGNSDVTISITESFTITSALPAISYASSATLTITSDSTTRTLTRGIEGGLFVISGNTIFENIIIDGDKDVYPNNTGSLVRVNSGGEFTLADGAVLRNNCASYYGGGVYVASGTFTMTGGKISGNTTNYNDGGVGGGGGVYVASGAFMMTGGEISSNTTNYNAGGGVLVYSSGTFTMTGGTISGNTANYFSGGGVYVYYGTFTMTGGTISGNTANYSSGGGVSGFSRTFILGGTAVITDNTHDNVYLVSGRYITLSTAVPPAPGFNVGVRMATGYGVFVESGASAAVASYFHADGSDLEIRHENGRLLIDHKELRGIGDYPSSPDDMIVNVIGNLVIVDPIIIPENPNGKTLTIRSADPENPVILTRGVSDYLFTVNSGAKLIFENIIIDGDKDNPVLLSDNSRSLVLVNSGGEFTMSDGAVLRNNTAPSGSVSNYGTFTMTGGEISGNTGKYYGGGVWVASGTFTMTGGEITGNTASDGGGVYVGGGTFTMTGGEITSNTANLGGGVYVDNGTFTMTGGEISGNTASYSGGVYVGRNGTFTMTGGGITGNTTNYSSGGGGGVLNSGTFTMTGGEISGNTASYASYGGGVIVNDGTFTLGGTAVIIGNAPDNVYLASGVYIKISTDVPPAPGFNVGVRMETGYGFFVESGASAAVASYFHIDGFDLEIRHENGRLLIDHKELRGIGDYPSSPDDMIINVSGNLVIVDPIIISANPNGKTLTIRSADQENPVILTRGVSGFLFKVNSGAKLIFENIIIDGDKDAYPDNTGSLVRVSGGEFTMADGAVLRNNCASSGGGGVYFENGTFTMTGGKISGNTASNGHGGGVYVYSGIFTMTGGEIFGNTASGNNAFYNGSSGVYVQLGAFTMTGGKISGNTASYNGGGVSVQLGAFTLGGTAVITGNTPDNVYLASGRYITLSTAVPPAPGFNIGVRMAAGYGFFVESGASVAVAACFHTDDSGREVLHENGRLRISGNVFHDNVADYAFASDDTVIEVKQDMAFADVVVILGNANGKTLTIRSADPEKPVVLTRVVSGDLFTVNSGAKLIFENIIIDGDKDTFSSNSGSLVRVNSGGEFAMADGAVLRNNSTSSFGGGVYAYGGAFTMTGGEISGNSSSSGGGVYASGIFTMTGGEISGNTASYSGGVYASGIFTMTGGEISGNTASYYGGGVYAYGSFTMTGGEITGNTASSGGGVYVQGGTFTMAGGEISGNSASSSSGGVYVNGGRFTLGGTVVITGNTPENVYLSSDRYITLSTAAPPALGMNVGITITEGHGVIVESAANTSHAQYFFADEPGKAVIFKDGQLVIETVPYTISASPSSIGFEDVQAPYTQPAAQNVTITKTGTGSVALTQPTARFYEIGLLSTNTLVADGSTATFNVRPKSGLPVGNYDEIITIIGGGASATVSASFTVTVPVSVPTYTVTVSSAGTGASGGGDYAPDEIVSINAGTPPPGQQFNNWTSSPAVAFANANNASTTFNMPSNAVTVTANFVTIPPPATYYAVTVSSAGTGATGGGNYVAGATVGINAGTPPEGQRFKNWTASPGVTFANANSANTTFTMPSNAVTVTANFEPDVQISEESIFVTGMRPEFQVGLARYDYSLVYAQGFYGYPDVEFPVEAGDGPFVLWIGLPDFPALTLDNIYPGDVIDVSSYFYDIAVPSGVSGVGISFFEDVWYMDGFIEGDVITLLKTNDEGLLVFERNGVYYEKTFVADGSNPFPGEEPGVEPVVTIPSASVEKLGGGKERLTISYTETLSDGSTVAGTMAVSINENTAGYYQVGQYLIYVDALGSGSIRRCYIVNRD